MKGNVKGILKEAHFELILIPSINIRTIIDMHHSFAVLRFKILISEGVTCVSV